MKIELEQLNTEAHFQKLSFDIRLSCDLSKNSYSVTSFNGTSFPLESKEGSFDELIACIKNMANSPCDNMLLKHFSREALSERFQADPENNFKSTFFRYRLGEAALGWAIIIAYIDQARSDADSPIFTLMLRSIDEFYGDTKAHKLQTSCQESGDCFFLQSDCRFAAILNPVSYSYEMLGGSFYKKLSATLPKEGHINNITHVLLDLFENERDLANFDVTCTLPAIADSFKSYDGYCFRRFLLNIDGKTRWHEFMFILLDENERKILFMLKDINDLFSTKLGDQIAPGDSEISMALQSSSSPDDLVSIIEHIQTPFAQLVSKPGVPIKVANSQFYDLIGYTKEEFEYRFDNMILALCHPADVPYARYNYNFSRETNHLSVDLEIRLLRGDGKIRWLKVEITHAQGVGDVIGYAKATDITDQKLNSQVMLSDQKNLHSTISAENILFDYDFSTDVMTLRKELSEKSSFPSSIENFSVWAFSSGVIYAKHQDIVKGMFSSIHAGNEYASAQLRLAFSSRSATNTIETDPDAHVWCKVTINTIFDKENNPVQSYGIIENINQVPTSEKDIPALYQATQSHFTNDLNHYVVNLTGDILEYVPKPTDDGGIDLTEYMGTSFTSSMQTLAYMFIPEDKRKEFTNILNSENLLQEYDLGNCDISVVFPIIRNSEASAFLKMMIHIVDSQSDHNIKAYIYTLDVSDEYQKINSLEFNSTRDPLTGLLNRAATKKMVDEHLSSVPLSTLNAFMLLDLDNFKEINDIYGHQNGDEYLKELADALTNKFSERAIICRLGGDEFILFFKQVTNTAAVDAIAGEILALVENVSDWHNPKVKTRASLGIALSNLHGTNFATLYKNADVALYHIKDTGKNNFAYYDDKLQNRSTPKASPLQERLKKRTSAYTKILTVVVLFSLLLATFMGSVSYKNAQEMAYSHALESLYGHVLSAEKGLDLYFDEKLSRANELSMNITRNYERILASEDPALLARKMHAYVTSYGFNSCFFASSDGDIVFPREYAGTYPNQLIASDLHYNEPTFISKSLYEMPDGQVGLGVVVPVYFQGEQTGSLVCTIDDDNLASCLESLLIYSDELCIFADPASNIITSASSEGSDASHYKRYSLISEYLEDHHYLEDGTPLTTSQVYSSETTLSTTSNGKKCCISSEIIAISAAPNTQFRALFIITEESLTHNISTQLNSLIILSFGICLVVLLISCLIIANNNRRNKYIGALAYKDSITNLNTMNYLLDNFDRLIKDHPVGSAIVSLAIDDFRIIKDTYGYSEGNKILTIVGNSLTEQLTHGETAVRGSDDRFCLLLRCDDQKTFLEKLRQLRSHIYTSCSRYMLTPINFSISLGVYLYGTVGSGDVTVEQALDYADIARGYGLSHSSTKIMFYNTNMQRELQSQKELEDSLDFAFLNGEFVPYFQPIASLSRGQILSAEALVRWLKPDGTTISPAKFIPIFEKNGTIVKLDYYMFEKVCEQLNLWKGSSLENLFVSVNMSRQHFYQSDFVENLLRITTKYGIPTSQIHVEITENMYIGDTERTNATLSSLRNLGFLISMDDFGTGYSSIAMLQTMPLDILKLDKQLLDSSIGTNNGDIVIRGVLDIAKRLGLKTICEGVETKEQLEKIKSFGCDMVQGYYYSPPLSARAFEEYFNSQK